MEDGVKFTVLAMENPWQVLLCIILAILAIGEQYKDMWFEVDTWL